MYQNVTNMLQIHEQKVLGVFISWISLWWLSRFGNTSGIEVEVVLLNAFGMTLSIVRMESAFMIIQMLRAAESKYWEAIECHYHSPPITHVKCIARSNLLIWFTLSAPGTLYAGENFMLRFRFPARHSFANLSKFKRCFCHGSFRWIWESISQAIPLRVQRLFSVNRCRDLDNMYSCMSASSLANDKTACGRSSSRVAPQCILISIRTGALGWRDGLHDACDWPTSD